MVQLIGVKKKIPFNFINYNFTTGFIWTWGYVDENKVLSMEGGFVRCKDHLMDMILSDSKKMPGFQFERHNEYDSPITVLICLQVTDEEKVAEKFQNSITSLLHPLEKENKWKTTQVEFVDKYLVPIAYSNNKTEISLFKVTASKMWRRNAFLGSIWASLLRMAYFQPNLTPDNFIDRTINEKLTGSNEFSYIKSQAGIIPNYKERWNNILTHLSKFKGKTGLASLHKNDRCKGHGTDGPFYGFNVLYMNNPTYLNQWYASHPFSSFLITPEEERQGGLKRRA